MWNADYIGKEYPSFTVEVEKGRLGFFARSIGDDNPVYQDEAVAKAAGFRSIPAPLTFPFSIMMDAGQGTIVLEDMDIDITKSVHGEQIFEYHSDICAGDVITGRQKILDMFEKKGGALQFIVTEIRLENQHGKHVCDFRTVIVVRNV
jgi:acyl dehydratase